MKYYIYISDTKLAMLYPQILKGPRDKVETEFKVDLGVVSAGRKRAEAREPDRYEQLDAVVKFIEEFGDIGTVDEPGEYFSGTMLMKWGPYGWGHDASAGLVYFGGASDQTIVGLGGSSHHLIGATRGDGVAHSHSATPFFEVALRRELNLTIEPRMEEFVADRAERGHPPLQGLLAAVELATTNMLMDAVGTKQSVEFVARRLAFGHGVLVGTPLYVALAQ